MIVNPDNIGSETRWERLGLVFGDEFAFPPSAYLINPETIRVYAAFVRNKIGEPYYVDFSAKDPSKIVAVAKKPVLEIGRPGAFDDNGVTPMCIVPHNNKLLMFYTGWQLSDKVRYFMFTGLAESNDNGETFQRLKETPVLERAPGELIVRTAAYVIKEKDLFRAWYVGGSDTIIVEGKQVPHYAMHYAETRDLLNWPKGQKIMDPLPPHEFGFGRPWVIPLINGGYEMYYSIRRSDCGYRIGYATSSDGLSWDRQDRYGLGTSYIAGENEMVGFTSIIETKYGRYMFYNGNDYGGSGIFAARFKG